MDFNGEGIGLFPIELKIAKFRGAKHINALDAFSLQYHAKVMAVRSDLLKCGRQFMSLRGLCHRHYNGKAFYICDREPVQVHINGRIMVDAVCFRKMNLNYFRPITFDLDHGFDISAFLKSFDNVSSDEGFSEASSDDASSATSFEVASETSHDQLKGSVVKQAEMPDEYLLICCPTVSEFSLKDKLWGKIKPF